MSDPIRTSGTYQDGVIHLDQPVPGLAGMALDIAVSFPQGNAQPAQVEIKAKVPGPQVLIGSDLTSIGHRRGDIPVPQVLLSGAENPAPFTVWYSALTKIRNLPIP